MEKDLEKVPKITFNGATFYAESFTGFSKEEFKAHEAALGFTEAQLDEVWSLLLPLIPKETEKPKPFVPAKTYEQLQEEKAAKLAGPAKKDNAQATAALTAGENK